MGEAKRRKAVDPSFGRSKRGIVVCAPLEINGTSFSIRSTHLDSQELRTWLLFFDQLIWPSLYQFQIGGGPDDEQLEQCGILKRPQYFQNGNGAESLANIQIRAFQEMDVLEPGRWALSQGERSLLVRNASIQDFGGVMLELLNAIPVPDKDVPLNEVLEFRLKRYDELEALRQELDKVADQISKADDKETELRNRLLAIDDACANAIRVSHEWQFPVRLANLKANIAIQANLGALIASGVAGYVNDLSTTATTLTAIGIFAASSVPTLKFESGMHWEGLKRKTGPYRYVYQYHRDLF